MSTTIAPSFGDRHKSHHFLAYKVAVAGTISLAAVLGYAEAPTTPDFTLATSPVALSVAQGSQGISTITTAISGGFDSAVNLSASGMPSGTTVSFNPGTISPAPGAGRSALTISVGSSTPLGTYPVTVTASGVSKTKTRTATVTLTVVPSVSLPTGYGWHELANTKMASVCLGNVSNGEYTDRSMTTTKNYDFNCNNFVPWSGGAGDDVNHQLIVWGGGHSDYAGNEVFVLKLNGTPSWQRFTNPTHPVPFALDQNAWEGLKPYYVKLGAGGVYQPGASPSSRHTYNGLQYVPYQNQLYSFGGGVANLGGFSPEVWTLDMGTGVWTMVGPPFSKSPGYPTTAYNPRNGHIVMHDKSSSLLDFDPHNKKWSTLSTSVHVNDGTTAAVDPVNNLMVFVGAGAVYPSVPNYRTVQVFSLSSHNWQAWNSSGCDLVYHNGGLAWDSALGLMVGYPGGGNQIYLLNTGPTDVMTKYGSVASHKCLDMTVSTVPNPVKGVDYPQDPEGAGSNNNGIFGRFAYFPSLDLFVVVNNRWHNAWVLRLPK